jgi:peptidoglycan/LPS O-acetylase OafA/YrhL
MLHAFVAVVMLHAIPRMLHLADIWKFGLAAAALVVTTLISIASFRFFEAPARRYFSSRFTARAKVRPNALEIVAASSSGDR